MGCSLVQLILLIGACSFVYSSDRTITTFEGLIFEGNLSREGVYGYNYDFQIYGPIIPFLYEGEYWLAAGKIFNIPGGFFEDTQSNVLGKCTYQGEEETINNCVPLWNTYPGRTIPLQFVPPLGRTISDPCGMIVLGNITYAFITISYNYQCDLLYSSGETCYNDVDLFFGYVNVVYKGVPDSGEYFTPTALTTGWQYRFPFYYPSFDEYVYTLNRYFDSNALFLSRVPVANFEDFLAWEVFNDFDENGNPQWIPDNISSEDSVMPIFSPETKEIDAATIYYSTFLQQFIIIYITDEGTYFAASDNPWGPYIIADQYDNNVQEATSVTVFPENGVTMQYTYIASTSDTQISLIFKFDQASLMFTNASSKPILDFYKPKLNFENENENELLVSRNKTKLQFQHPSKQYFKNNKTLTDFNHPPNSETEYGYPLLKDLDDYDYGVYPFQEASLVSTYTFDPVYYNNFSGDFVVESSTSVKFPISFVYNDEIWFFHSHVDLEDDDDFFRIDNAWGKCNTFNMDYCHVQLVNSSVPDTYNYISRYLFDDPYQFFFPQQAFPSVTESIVLSQISGAVTINNVVYAFVLEPYELTHNSLHYENYESDENDQCNDCFDNIVQLSYYFAYTVMFKGNPETGSWAPTSILFPTFSNYMYLYPILDPTGEWVYLYGTDSLFEGSPGDIYLARVSPDQIETQSAWQYYSEDLGWSNNHLLGTPIRRANAYEVAVTWNSYLQKYILLYWDYTFVVQYVEEENSTGSALRLFTSSSPEGPWENGHLLYYSDIVTENDRKGDQDWITGTDLNNDYEYILYEYGISIAPNFGTKPSDLYFTTEAYLFYSNINTQTDYHDISLLVKIDLTTL